MLPRALRNSVFARLLASFVFVEFASTATFIALPLVAYDRSGSGQAFALVMLGGSIGRLVAMPIGGVLADRFDRRRIMLTGEATLLLVLAAVVACVHWELWGLLALAQLAQNVTGSLFESAPPALRRDVVADDEREQSASLMQLASSTTLLLGPLVGAALYTGLGFEAVVALNAVSLLTSLALTASWTHPSSRPERSDVMRAVGGHLIGNAVRATAADVRIAARAARRDPYLSTAMVMALFVGAGNGLFNVALVPWLDGPLDQSTSITGALVASIGGASIVTGLVLSRFVDRVSMTRLTAASAVGSFVFPFLLIGTPGIGRLFAAFLLLGFYEPLFSVATTVIRQRRIPSHLQGRIPSLWTTLFLVTNVTSIAIGGALVTSVDPRWIIAAAAACWLIMAPLTLAMAVFAGRAAPLVEDAGTGTDDTALAVGG